MKISPKMDQKIIYEFQFTIRVQKINEKKDYYSSIKESLKKAFRDHPILTYSNFERGEYEDQNMVYLILKSSFDKHFMFSGNNRAYLTNYSEQEGSLIINFSILILTTVLNYGGIRESIDYYVKDLKFLFGSAERNGVVTDITYREINKHYNETPETPPILLQEIEKIKKSIAINRALSIIILVIISSSTLYLMEKLDENTGLNKDEIENLLKSQPKLIPNDTKIEVTIKKDELTSQNSKE